MSEAYFILKISSLRSAFDEAFARGFATFQADDGIELKKDLPEPGCTRAPKDSKMFGSTQNADSPSSPDSSSDVFSPPNEPHVYDEYLSDPDYSLPNDQQIPESPASPDSSSSSSDSECAPSPGAVWGQLGASIDSAPESSAEARRARTLILVSNREKN